MILDSLTVTTSIMLVSFLTSGFCSSMESAYLSLDRIAIKKLEKSGSLISRLVLFYLNHLNGLISSILIFNLFSNIIGTLSANTLFFWYLETYWEFNRNASSSTWNVIWETVFVIIFTFMILILSEFVPKRITILHPKFFATTGSVFMLPVYIVLYPAVFLIFQLSDFLKKAFMLFSGESGELAPQEKKKNLPIYRHELLGYVEKISSQGGLHKLETDWLVHLFFYMNTPVSSIMITRENMEGLDSESFNQKDILPLIKKFLFSNIPIYKGGKDNVIGIISKKEIALRHRKGLLSREELGRYIRKPLFLPKNKNVMEVLRDIYHSDLEIALIVDEHGGVEGLISANHIVMRIFERVGNEDNDVLKIRQVEQDLFSIHSEVSIIDVNQFFGINLNSDRCETIGGYLLEKFKYIPKKEETYEDDFFVYTIKSRTPKKIIRIEVRRK